jgi:CheY-like chemotaxis protein
MEPKTVLVVDDDVPTLQAYTALLQDCGYRVMEATNGGEAILCVRRSLPDVILMDIVMPIVDGLEAAESLRQYPSTANIPIIALTGRAQEVERERMQRLCNDLLLKPCPPQAIIERVRHFAS